MAAGGVLYRPGVAGEEVLVVHRKRYDDWTLPKGKLKEGESFVAAALREVKEETGFVASVNKYLGAIGYEVNGVPKAVLFWRMSPAKEREIEDRAEVAEAVWMPLNVAAQRLSYADERAVALRASEGGGFMDKDCPSTEFPPLKGWRRWLWAQRHDYARLQREYAAFAVDLALLESREGQSEQPWAVAAHCQMKNIQDLLEGDNKNVEGGWVCLHAARRYAVYALDLNELIIQADALRAEAPKFKPSWRAGEVERLLAVKDDGVNKNDQPEREKELKARVIKAMELRDEHFSNQYHKIWLKGSQLRTLLFTFAVSLLLLAPFVVDSTRCPEIALKPWSYQMVTAVLFFGLLGAAISAVGSLMSDKSSGIPERVANQFVTNARAWFGAGVGLAGYAFYQSKVLDIQFGSDSGSAGALAVAFAFGFLGERLIVHVLGSLGADKS